MGPASYSEATPGRQAAERMVAWPPPQQGEAMGHGGSRPSGERHDMHAAGETNRPSFAPLNPRLLDSSPFMRNHTRSTRAE